MRPGKGGDETVGGERATLCVSSEVGCQMGCTFCATGTMGLVADLTAGEIIEQLVHANAVQPIRNVVFMVSLAFYFILFYFVSVLLMVITSSEYSFNVGF